MARFFFSWTVHNNTARRGCDVFVKDDWKDQVCFLKINNKTKTIIKKKKKMFLASTLAKVTLFRRFSFLLRFVKLYIFGFLKNEYIYGN